MTLTSESSSYDWLRPDSEQALAWEAEQGERTRRALRRLPWLPGLAERIEPYARHALTDMLDGTVRMAGRWFRLDRDPDRGQVIRISETPRDPGRILVDADGLARLHGRDEPATMVYVDPAPDGGRVAITHTSQGQAFGQCSVLDSESGELVGAPAATMVGNAIRPAWLPDGSGFYLHGRTPDQRHQLRFHRMPVDSDIGPVAGGGTPVDDVGTGPTSTVPLFDVPSTALAMVPQVSPDGRHVVCVTVPHEHLATTIGTRPPDTNHEGDRRWRSFLPDDFHGELHGDWLDDETYVAIATDRPTGRVVAIPVDTSTDQTTWRELVPSSDLVLRSVQVVSGRLLVAALHDVSLDLRVHRSDGTLVGRAPLPPASASIALTGPGRVQPRTESLVFSASSFTVAETRYRLDEATAELDVLATGAALDGVTTEQHFATSADGTRIPYFVVARDDLISGPDARRPLPTLVTAYGGFNMPWLPAFLGEYTPFVSAGGVHVHANLRGGSEYGRDWFEAGRFARKPNVFADLRAVAEDLIARGIASPSTLAFHGRSNGGLVAAVAAVQQADLWRVVVPEVPVLDVLDPVAEGPGAEAIRAVYAQDYGDPRDPEIAAVLRSYSPCRIVRPGVGYPAVFTLVGRQDIGCPPSAARRFVAALQDATTSGLPVHLMVAEGVGHGSLDPREVARQQAAWMAFVMDQLGMDRPGTDRLGPAPS